jgi:Skp family chaperone for outer membrane proteins
MRNVLTVAVTALWLMGAGTFAVAEDAMKGEMDQMNTDIKAEKEAMKADTKTKKTGRTKKAHKHKNKTKQREMRDKSKAPSEAAKPQNDVMPTPNTAGENTKPAVPDLPAPSAPGAR